MLTLFYQRSAGCMGIADCRSLVFSRWLRLSIARVMLTVLVGSFIARHEREETRFACASESLE